MTNQDIKEKFEQTRSRYLIGKIDHAFQSNQFVQVVLNIVSEEADIIGVLDAEQDVFDYNSKNSVCYVKFDNFISFLDDDYDPNMTYDEEIELIENYLQDKLVVIKPYYYFNDSRRVFFKNGTVADVVEKSISYADSFYTIPVIPNEKAFDSFMKNEQFPMPNISKEIMGTPNYLYYNGSLYKATLNALDTNDVYWQNEEGEKAKYELNVDCSQLKRDNDLIISDNDIFVFVRKLSILNSKAKVIIEKEEITNNVEEVGVKKVRLCKINLL